MASADKSPRVADLLRREVAASLCGLGRLPAPSAGEVDVEALSVAAEYVGDALRLGVTLPLDTREWLSSWTSENVWSVAGRTQEWIEAIALPGGERTTAPAAPIDVATHSAAEEWFDSLEEAVIARDRAESVVVGLAYAVQLATAAPVHAVADGGHHGMASACLPAIGPVVGVLSAFDDRLADLATRSTIEAALGDRIEMLAPRDWTARFDMPRAADGESAAPIAAGPSLGDGPLAQPPDTVVASYVHSGLHARWVEGVAARTPTFRDELAALIGEAHADTDGEPTSLAALVWRGHALPDAGMPRILGQRLVMAAASADAEPPARTERLLGRLGAVPAEAVLVQKGRDFVLSVFAEPDTLTLVEIDGQAVSADEHGDFRQPLRGDGASVALRVLSRDGEVFEGRFVVGLPR